MTLTQRSFEPQPSRMVAATTPQINDTQKAPEATKPEAPTEAATYEQDSAILTSSDVKAGQDESKNE